MHTKLPLRRPRVRISEPNDEYLNTKEAARYIGVSTHQLRAYCKLEGLRHVRLSVTPHGQIRIKREWVDEWMRARAVVQNGRQP